MLEVASTLAMFARPNHFTFVSSSEFTYLPRDSAKHPLKVPAFCDATSIILGIDFLFSKQFNVIEYQYWRVHPTMIEEYSYWPTDNFFRPVLSTVRHRSPSPHFYF